MDRLISEQAVLDAIKEPIMMINYSKSRTEILQDVEDAVKAIPSTEYETEITKYSDDEKYKALITLYLAKRIARNVMHINKN